MADIIGPLFGAIIDKIEALNVFAEVKPALNGGQLAVPSAEVWLAEDKEIPEMPSVTRDFLYCVQVTVGFQDDGTTQAVLHPLLDSLRNDFSNWLPNFIGVKPVTVPLVAIAASEDHGKTTYLLHIKIRVFIDTFRTP